MIMTARWSGSLAASAADENSSAIDVTAGAASSSAQALADAANSARKAAAVSAVFFAD
jgi:hypothetical protein